MCVPCGFSLEYFSLFPCKLRSLLEFLYVYNLTQNPSLLDVFHYLFCGILIVQLTRIYSMQKSMKNQVLSAIQSARSVSYALTQLHICKSMFLNRTDNYFIFGSCKGFSSVTPFKFINKLEQASLINN